MRRIKAVWILMALLSTVYGVGDSAKHSLKCNMVHVYDEVPGDAKNLTEMFSEGMFYGRLRFNSFGFQWKEEIENERENHAVAAIGASLNYQSARLNGFNVGTGLYMTQNHGTLEDEEVKLYKAGKGTFSRYDLLSEDASYMVTLAQAFLQYTYEETSLKVGRQIFESYLTKSNDTKMIPNTFEGLTLITTALPDTKLQMAYFTRQKLRDHTEFHHLLAYGDNESDPYAKYSENDDSAMHKGLTLSELKNRGIDDRLIIAEAKNRSIDNVTLTMNYTAVSELISSAMIQADYTFDLGDMYIIPGFRYMRQFDDGAGEIGGANLKTRTEGYSDPDSLDSELYGARVSFVEDGFKLRFGYTKVADKGDLVAPWRGFPTDGFTRSMAQYNWYANTESFMVQFDYEFDSFDQFKVISRYALQNFDDSKVGVQADSNVFEINFLKGLGESPLYLKTRFAHVVGDDNTYAVDGSLKADPSYDELRIEVNYLF